MSHSYTCPRTSHDNSKCYVSDNILTSKPMHFPYLTPVYVCPHAICNGDAELLLFATFQEMEEIAYSASMHRPTP